MGLGISHPFVPTDMLQSQKFANEAAPSFSPVVAVRPQCSLTGESLGLKDEIG